MEKTSTLLFVLFAAFTIQAQDAIVVSGGEASGPGGSSSYSVGQALYTTNTSNTGSLVQGVQQAVEIFTLSNTNFTALTLSAVVYPNPANDKIVLSLRDSSIKELSYVLYDLNGKVLYSGLVQQSETRIALHSLQRGIYILKVNKNNNELKTFKVIKK